VDESEEGCDAVVTCRDAWRPHDVKPSTAHNLVVSDIAVVPSSDVCGGVAGYTHNMN
jgi:hypothetical protein